MGNTAGLHRRFLGGLCGARGLTGLVWGTPWPFAFRSASSSRAYSYGASFCFGPVDIHVCSLVCVTSMFLPGCQVKSFASSSKCDECQVILAMTVYQAAVKSNGLPLRLPSPESVQSFSALGWVASSEPVQLIVVFNADCLTSQDASTDCSNFFCETITPWRGHPLPVGALEVVAASGWGDWVLLRSGSLASSCVSKPFTYLRFKFWVENTDRDKPPCHEIYESSVDSDLQNLSQTASGFRLEASKNLKVVGCEF